MEIKTRLARLEKFTSRSVAEADCICFPADEPPDMELQAEREAAKAVLCPLHGARFSEFAPSVYRSIRRPPHLEPEYWSWRSLQYQKAMEASFPPDRWPATEITDPDGTVRYVLKDGTEIHRIEPFELYDYATGLPIIGDTTLNGTRSAAGPPAAMPSKSDETLLSEAARREEIVVKIELDGGISTAPPRTPSEIEITIPD